MDQIHRRSTAAPAVHQRIDDPDLPSHGSNRPHTGQLACGRGRFTKRTLIFLIS
jgi:hypothetical protein